MEDEILPSSAWRDHSFFFEMKPRRDFASLFMDCAAASSEEKKFVRVGNNSLEIHDGVDDGDENCILTGGARFKAKIADIRMSPNSVCGSSWADTQRRLFMCKVRVDGEDGVAFPRKSFRGFEENLRSRYPIGECIDSLLEGFEEMRVTCRQCQGVLHSHFKRDVDFDVLPEDDWLDTSPGMEYFCGQSCGHGGNSCNEVGHLIVDHTLHHQRNHPHPYYEGLLGISSSFSGSVNAAQRWLPSASKVVFSNSFLMLLANEALKKRVDYTGERCVLTCRQCDAELGIPQRGFTNVFKLHVGAVRIFGGGDPVNEINGEVPQDYIISRFTSFERYFAWMFLYKSESQSSMKLLIRTYDRKPYILIWLLEPYVIIASGILQTIIREEDLPVGDENRPPRSEKQNDRRMTEDPEEVRPFSALKILYKIYDERSAATDPRANGGDSSVGIVDIPHSCCLKLAEILLRSSHSLPPTLRAVGQLFVGYLCLNEGVE